jgi:ADP-ribose pyrophosphatase
MGPTLYRCRAMQDSPRPWRTLSTQTAFDHPWYRLRRDVVELPDGSILDDYFIAERSDVAIVVAVTEESEILLARQYKHGIGEVTIELPGGVIEDGEPAIAAAERELREELGYACDQLEPLGTLLHAPSNATNRIYGFFGTRAHQVGGPSPDATEEIALERVPLRDVESLIRAGHIAATDTVALLMLAVARMQRG